MARFRWNPGCPCCPSTGGIVTINCCTNCSGEVATQYLVTIAGAPSTTYTICSSSDGASCTLMHGDYILDLANVTGECSTSLPDCYYIAWWDGICTSTAAGSSTITHQFGRIDLLFRNIGTTAVSVSGAISHWNTPNKCSGIQNTSDINFLPMSFSTTFPVDTDCLFTAQPITFKATTGIGATVCNSTLVTFTVTAI